MAGEREAWAALRRHHEQIRDVHLRTFFAEGRNRGERLVLEAAGLYLDYSKNRVTDETLALLLALAEAAGLRARIDAMFSGQKVNITEGRAVQTLRELAKTYIGPDAEFLPGDGLHRYDPP